MPTRHTFSNVSNQLHGATNLAESTKRVTVSASNCTYPNPANNLRGATFCETRICDNSSITF